MNYPQTKVYFDGSHYIGIPQTTQTFKKRKNKAKVINENEQKVKEIYKEIIGTKKEKTEKTIEEINKEINKEINDIEKSTKLVNEILEKEKRNQIVRQTRLSRKLGLQNWTHFCTFTYDSQKLNEEEFKKKFLNCLRYLSNRKGWKYIGVFERSPKVNRLHFHGIFVIKEMIIDQIFNK